MGHVRTVLFSPEQLPYTILAIIPVLLLLVGAFMCPFACCGRYCCNCCGGYRRRPDAVCCGDKDFWDEQPEQEKNAQYPRSSVLRTKCCAFVLVFIAIAAIPTGISGTILLQDNYDSFFVQAKSVLSWALGQSTSIRVLMTINATGQLIPPLEETLFHTIGNVTADLGAQIDSTKSSADQVAAELVTLSVFLFAVSIVFLALTAVAACLNIRAGLLCCTSIAYYLLFLIFGIVATLLLLLSPVLAGICGERQLFLDDPVQPGLFSLALVPICTDNFPFEAVPGEVRAVITEQAVAACTSIEGICSQTAAFDSTRPNEVFHCPALTNATADCPTFGAANSVAASLSLKPSTPTQCVNNSNVVTPCTLSLCGEICNQQTVQSTSKSASDALHYASNAEIAFNVFVAPLLSCHQLYRQVLAPLESCDPMVAAMNMAGVSALVMELVLFAGLIGVWRGQKRFFPLAEAGGETPQENPPPFDDVKHEPFEA